MKIAAFIVHEVSLFMNFLQTKPEDQKKSKFYGLYYTIVLKLSDGGEK